MGDTCTTLATVCVGTPPLPATGVEHPVALIAGIALFAIGALIVWFGK